MDKKNVTKPTRIPNEVYMDLDDALNIRFKNNLIKRKEFKMTEGLRLVRRMPEWKMAMNKLKTMPRKEDINNAQGLF